MAITRRCAPVIGKRLVEQAIVSAARESPRPAAPADLGRLGRRGRAPVDLIQAEARRRGLPSTS